MIDPHTLEVTLTQPDVTFLYALTQPFMSPVPKEVVQKYGKNFSTHVVGNGPFKLEKYDSQGQTMLFSRFDKYFWSGLPYLDEVQFIWGIDPGVQILKLQRGEVDLLGDGFSAQALARVNASSSLKKYLFQEPLLSARWTNLHPRVPAFKDKRVRQALNYATDRAALERLTSGEASAWGVPFPKGMLGKQRTFKPYTFDLDRAKSLMKAAGVSNVQATLWVSDDPEPLVGQFLQQAWQAVGVHLTLKQATADAVNELLDQEQDRRLDLDLLRDLPDRDRPDQPVLGVGRRGQLHALQERPGRHADRAGAAHGGSGEARRVAREGRDARGQRCPGRVPRERQLADGPQPGSPEELQLLGCLRHVLRPSLGLRLRPPARRRAEWPRRTFIVGVVLLGSMIALALAAPLFGNPYAIPLDGLSPAGLPRGVLSPGHLLGTDQLGRDMLARTAYGARASLEIAFIANITSVGIGTVVGLVAGFYRGWIEHVLMRVTDIFLAVPTVISGLALAATLGTGITGIVVVVTALYWAWTARIVFGETLALRRRTFVEAAIAQGAPGHMVIRRHILPNLTSLILTLAALNGAAVVAIGAGLAYLGAGIQPPRPEWGNMLADGQDSLDYAPHLLLVPLVCVVVTVFSFVLIGEALSRRGAVSLRRSWLDI